MRSSRTPAMPILMAHHLPLKPKGSYCSGHALLRRTAFSTQKSDGNAKSVKRLNKEQPYGKEAD